jgi:aspartate ammonia-lyase
MAHKQTFSHFFKEDTMTLDEIKQTLQDRNLRAVALNTGVSPHTLYRLVRGMVTPHPSTLQVISSYLKASHG